MNTSLNFQIDTLLSIPREQRNQDQRELLDSLLKIRNIEELNTMNERAAMTVYARFLITVALAIAIVFALGIIYARALQLF